MTTLLPAGRHVPVVMGDGNTHYLAHTSYGDSSKLKALHVAGPATQQSLLTPALTQPLGTHTLPGLHPQAWRPVGPGSAQRAVGSTAQVAGGRVQGAAGGSRTRAASSRSALMAGSSPAQPGSGGRGQRAGSSPAQGGMPAQAASSSRVQAASTNNLWFVKAALEIAAAEARARVPGGSSSQAAASSGAGPSGAGAGQAAAGWGAAGAGPPAAGQSGAEAGQLAAAPKLRTPASSEGSWDEGLAEAARDNAFGQLFVQLFQDPVWRKTCGIEPGVGVSITQPTPDDDAASFRFCKQGC